MAVKEARNFLSSQRVDVVDLKAVESGNIFDFQSFLQILLGTGQPYILRGFDIPISGIGSPATSLSMVVADGAVFVPDDANGPYILVPSATGNETLNTSNAKVSGSFVNGTNYVGLQFTRQTDSGTNDIVKFIDVASGSEISKTVPRGLVLEYQIVIQTADFGSTAPVAIVEVSGGNVTSITNAKRKLTRLGTGGETPDIHNSYTYPTLPENPITATSSSDPDIWSGGDWELDTLKQWMDAVMTELKTIKGTPFWYSSSSSSVAIADLSLLNTWVDANGSVVMGNGVWKHDESTPGLLIWTSDIVLNTIIGSRKYTVAAGQQQLAEGEVAYIDLVRNNDFQPSNSFTFTAASPTITSVATISGISPGDWIKFHSDPDTAWREVSVVGGTSITLSSNYPNTSSGKALKSTASYTIQVASETAIPSSADVYWIAKRESGLSAISVSTTTYERTSDVATIGVAAHSFVEGQTVAIAGMSDTDFNGTFEITATTGTSISFNNNGADVSTAADVGGAITAPAKIYLRQIGELIQGEEEQVGDTVPKDVLDFMGSQSDTDSTPFYNNLTPSSLDTFDGSSSNSNFNSVQGENLTIRNSKNTAMIADIHQTLNVRVDMGTVVWDGTDVTITSASLFVHGIGVVSINTFGPAALPDGNVLYVDLDRNSGAALTIQSSSYSALSTLNLTSNRIFLITRSGSDLISLY